MYERDSDLIADYSGMAASLDGRAEIRRGIMKSYKGYLFRYRLSYLRATGDPVQKLYAAFYCHVGDSFRYNRRLFRSYDYEFPFARRPRKRQQSDFAVSMLSLLGMMALSGLW